MFPPLSLLMSKADVLYCNFSVILCCIFCKHGQQSAVFLFEDIFHIFVLNQVHSWGNNCMRQKWVKIICGQCRTSPTANVYILYIANVKAKQLDSWKRSWVKNLNLTWIKYLKSKVGLLEHQWTVVTEGRRGNEKHTKLSVRGNTYW